LTRWNSWSKGGGRGKGREGETDLRKKRISGGGIQTLGEAGFEKWSERLNRKGTRVKRHPREGGRTWGQDKCLHFETDMNQSKEKKKEGEGKSHDSFLNQAREGGKGGGSEEVIFRSEEASFGRSENSIWKN